MSIVFPEYSYDPPQRGHLLREGVVCTSSLTSMLSNVLNNNITLTFCNQLVCIIYIIHLLAGHCRVNLVFWPCHAGMHTYGISLVNL